MAAVRQDSYKGYTYQVYVDDDPPNPSEWDQLGKIVYSIRSRNLLGYEAVSDRELEEIAIGIKSGRFIGLPVYAYVHSGATIRAAETNPFTCPWDSGQSGFVYVERERALEQWMRKRMSPKLEAKVLAVLEAQVEEFDQYLQGDVYFFAIRKDGEIVDTCSGIYGLDEAEKQAKTFIDAEVKAEKERIANTQQKLPI